MDFAAKHEIDRLDKQQIPWRRMFTAYGTAENDCEYLSVLEQTLDVQEWKKTFRKLSDFEHQSTFFPPAPFALVFLVRILQKRLQDGNADEIVELLTDQLLYYADLCSNAEQMEHAQPLDSFSKLLDDRYLLPEDYTEEDLFEVFENPEAISDELFYSFYYYAGIVLSQVPDILDQHGIFPEKSKAFRDRTARTNREKKSE